MRRRDFLLTASLAAALPNAVFRPAKQSQAAGATVPAQADARFDEIAALITKKMAEYHVPAAALGVIKNGRVTLRGFGVTNVDDPQPVTADTLFTIASISKTFTT